MTHPADPIASPALLDAIAALQRMREKRRRIATDERTQNQATIGDDATGQGLREVSIPGMGGKLMPRRDGIGEEGIPGDAVASRHAIGLGQSGPSDEIENLMHLPVRQL